MPNLGKHKSVLDLDGPVHQHFWDINLFCAGGDHSDLASLRVIKTIQPRENRPSPNPKKRARNLLGDVENRQWSKWDNCSPFPKMSEHGEEH